MNQQFITSHKLSFIDNPDMKQLHKRTITVLARYLFTLNYYYFKFYIALAFLFIVLDLDHLYEKIKSLDC